MSELNELSRDFPEPHGRGWRRLDPPVTVRAYFANQWHDALAVDINDDTREIRMELPRIRDANGVDLVSHKVLSADLYDTQGKRL